MGGLPVRLTPSSLHTGQKASDAPARIEVALKGRAAAHTAGVEGLLMTLRPTATAPSGGPVKVEIDYSSIRGAYAAGWSSRLRLVTLPACALTTPEKAECRQQTPLATENNTSSHTLAADLTVPAPATSMKTANGLPKAGASAPSASAVAPAGMTVLAATAGAGGSDGSFKATSLSSSGSWSAGGNSGGFGWNMPIDVPAAPGGLAPKVALSYNSSSVDGRTASTNNQSSWIGEGWEYSPGFIERRYASCENDKQGGNNTVKTGDLCWKSENATLSLNGSSSELVWDSAKKTWKLANDDGSRVERIYDTEPNDSGDEDFEYWRVTSLDGTQYWFGKNHLPGWTAGKEETNSVFSAPVYGNHTGEPGNATDFASSTEKQGWRWNLDYVVDPHGNAMALYYTKEEGYYAQNNKTDTPKPYTRGGYLNRIDYGLRADTVYATANPAGRVTFTTGNRCTATDCAFTETNATNWPDTPVDLNCTSGSKCLQGSPSFWSKQRLTSINTFSLVGTSMAAVDTWSLSQSFPATGDISTPAMWLDSVQRTAKAGSAADIKLDKVFFEGELMPNRVDAIEGRPALNRKRITKITNETGGQTLVTYTAKECTPTTLPAADKNNKRCYPAWWTPDGAIEPVKDWFHKYLISRIDENDTTGGSGSQSKVTSYTYSGGPHWRRDTGEFTLDKHRTWNVFRGYATVHTYNGGDSNRRRTTNTYYLGMAGDTLADGSTRQVAAINGITDREDFAGRLASSTTYDKAGTGGKAVAKTTYIPWQSGTTATQAVKGITDPDLPGTPAPTLPAKTAQLSGTTAEKSSTLLDNGSTWHPLTTTRTYDTTYGLLTKETDDGAGTVEARCTLTTYTTPDTTNWLISYPSEITTTTDTAACLTTPGEITSHARTYYDGQTLGTAPKPGKANVTKAEQLTRHTSGSTPVWETTSETTYDQYGRVLVAKGQDGQPTTTAYTPASGAQPTTVSTTNAKGHNGSTTFDGMRGLALTTTDTNGRTTASEYDALGRVTKAWSTGRAKTLQPNATFTYNLSTTVPSTVIAKKLHEDGLWGTSVSFYDSFLRERQTQADSIGVTGRVVTDTFYDTHGRPYLTNAPYYNSSALSTTTMFVVTPNQVPQAFQSTYDGRGRVTESIQLSLNVPQWKTTHTYGDYWTATVPPDGGTATLTLTDVRGRTIEERQYKDRNPVPDAAPTQYEKTTRTYNTAGLLASLTDSSGRNTWRYTYDLRGRQVGTIDPDKGQTVTHYDADGRVDTVTDARGILATTYDELGRKTTLRSGSATGTKLAEWTYDTATGGKGLPHKSTRYDTANANAAYTTEVTGYDATGRSTGTKVTVPSITGEELLAGTYTVATTATPVSGLSKTAVYSTTNTNATTALPSETVTNHYGSNDTLAIVDSSLDHAYLRGAGYTPFGELAQAQLGNLGSLVTQTLTYETSTRRLVKNQINRAATGPATLSNLTYGYDPAGNITSIRDAQNDGTVTDDQCFTYDWARRLTDAWSSGDACATKSVDGVGSPNLGTTDPYQTSWTFTDTGQRKTETLYKAGSITANTTRTYTYPTTPGAAQAHAVRSVTATGGTTGTDTYTYDDTGNLTKKTPAVGPVQDLTWNEEGKLKTSSISGQTTSFLYGAEGTRIIKREPTRTTLYLPGGQELELTRKAGTTPAALANGTRYYGVPGGSVIRTSRDNSVRILVSDHHNTNTLSISASSLAVNRRKALPYGGQRGAAPYFWPGNKGFVGGDIDTTTNLTHIGAREYDPNLGQFISSDPLLEIGKPQTLNGYAYAANNPTTFSDPTGTCLDAGNGHCEDDSAWTPSGNLKPDGGQPETPTPTDSGNNGTNGGSGGGGGGRGNNKGSSGNWFSNFGKSLLDEGIKFGTGIWNSTSTEFSNIGNCITWDGTCKEALSDLNNRVNPSVIAIGAAEGILARGKEYVDDFSSGNSAQGTAKIAFDVLLAVAAKKVAPRSIAPRCPNSFVPGTLVVVSNGKVVPIQDLTVGDKVLATDPESGETVEKEVTDTIIGVGEKKLVKISIDVDGKTGKGTASITATHNHPFWVPSLHAWIDATKLSPGQWLRTSAGTHVQITEVQRWTQQAIVHNLTVADIHTYYVMAGATPVLVHNCPAGGGGFFSNLFKSKAQLADEEMRAKRVPMRLGNLEGIGLPDLGDPKKLASVGGMDDQRLLDSINDPDELGGSIVLGDGEVIQGNHRIAEALRRMGNSKLFTPDREILVVP
ncbi:MULTISPECIES: polymorphic toxin-type HINT domain-containing protein [unclassified Streptomyces]|uniref:polymorphic toxin-type HINT domain-containing protein n=1 Tax=unclassified Streptomyces TaxID=2593676 RepID=UPI0037F30031